MTRTDSIKTKELKKQEKCIYYGCDMPMDYQHTNLFGAIIYYCPRHGFIEINNSKQIK